MAKHEDDIDLVKLFRLSRDEASGLGLDASGQPPTGVEHDTTDVAGLPAHAEPAPLDLPIVTAHSESESPVVVPVEAHIEPEPSAPRADNARIADDIALLAMLNGLEAPGEYSGHGAARGLALALEATDSPASLPPALQEHSGTHEFDTNGEDGGTRFVVVENEDEDDVDVVSIFSLSSDEALGLGLAQTAPSEPKSALDGAPADQDETAVGTPALDLPFPTMYLHAAGADAMMDSAVVASDPETGEETATTLVSEVEAEPTPGPQLLAEDGDAPGFEQAGTPEWDEGVVAPAWDEGVVASSVAATVKTQNENHGPALDAMAGERDDLQPSAAPRLVAAGSSPEIDPALLDAFAEESAELLDGMHVELERLENNQNDHEALLETRRTMHTLKGGAKMCGFEQVVTLTHSCENLLDLISEGAMRLDANALHALFACEPLLRIAVQNALMGSTDEVKGLFDLAAYFDALRVDAQPTAYHETPVAHAETPVAHAETPPVEECLSSETPARDEPAPDVTVAAPPRQTRLINTQVTVSDTDEQTQATLETPAAPEPRSGGRRTTNSLHVDLAKVDAVVAKVTEMAAHRVSSQGMMGQLMEATEEARRNTVRLHALAVQLGNEAAVHQPPMPARHDELGLESYSSLNTLALQLQEAVSDQQALIQSIHDTITSHWRLKATESRIDADIQSALMNIRLIPITNMRVRLDGVVRQAAQATGKMVRWQLQGGAVAVEKNVFDRLFEPLMHLLRNSIDHGIEAPGARLDAGKAESGSIVVNASQEGNQIVISVTDDGAGIVPNRIAGLAVERGVVSADEANSMTPQQKISLIFTPGFSTADEVSHISGRGVGMDVVRETCLRMGGSIDVHSRPGMGTTITMRLPLSLSVARGLIVRDGGCLMALPVSQISALHLVSATDMIHTSLGRMARIEGQELPIYNLPPLPGARMAGYVRNGEVHVLQVPHEGGSIGIVIEDVLDEEEILIKAPPALLRHITTLLGAYVLPDGSVAPVINMPQMLADLRPVATLTPPREDSKVQERMALIVDDSMSMRVALSGTLQSAGFSVLTARDGQEALDMLKREGLPSLITLDIEMPRMDGLETLFAIRQMPGARELPVFMMTSRGGAKHRRAADQLGATRYFTKPYRDSELASAARAAVAE